MSKNIVKEIIAPILVLTAICLVCSGALAGTYQTTKPIIDEAAAREAEAARSEVFVGATEFEEYEGELPAGATEIFRVNGGEGYVITAVTKGFGGEIEVMTGVNSAGEITGVKVLSMSETSGLGTQIAEDWYIEKYVGQSNVDGVETIAGSTVSSAAFKNLLKDVLAMVEEISGGAA